MQTVKQCKLLAHHIYVIELNYNVNVIDFDIAPLQNSSPEVLSSSDVKRGQNLETEAEARALRPRPRPEL